jgi:protein phosphatase 1 regulatory subunit 12C
MAAARGHVEVVRVLLEAGASPAALDSCLCTPLHVAAEWGQAAVASALLEHVAAAQEAAQEAGRRCELQPGGRRAQPRRAEGVAESSVGV